MSLFKKQTSFMKKRQEIPMAYWIIIIAAIVIAVVTALFVPIPRKFKWLLFYAIFLVLAFAGIMLYSKFGNSKGRR